MAGHEWGRPAQQGDGVAGLQPHQGERPPVEGHPETVGRAASTDTAPGRAAWFTVHWVECHLLYGKAKRAVGGRRRGRSDRPPWAAGNAAVGVRAGHAVEAGPECRQSRLRCWARLRPSVGPQGVLDHGVLLDRLPESVGHLHGFHQRTLPAVHDVGLGPWWPRFDRVATRAFEIAYPTFGLTPDHGGQFGPTRHHCGQCLVDEGLLGDAQLEQVGLGFGGAHPVGNQAARVRVLPAPLRERRYGPPARGSPAGPA